MTTDQQPPLEPVRALNQHVFISYSRTDLAYVRKLALYLERQGIRVWYDYKIETGEPFSRAIQIAIDGCFAFVFVQTKASVKSKWTYKEIDRAAQQKKPIVPILLEKGAKSDHIEVSGLNWDDVTKGNMPSRKTIERLRQLSLPPDPIRSQPRRDGPPAITATATAALKRTSARLWRRWRSILLATALGAVATWSLVATHTEVPSWLLSLGAIVGGAISAAVCVGVDRRRIVLADPFRRDPAATPRVPPGQSQFRGRTVELDTWRRVHRRARERRETKGAHALGPVVLAIHGAAGIGKSTFAHALADTLRDQYPDGYFVVSFGASGTGRSPADISRDLLLQLGWPPKDMPDETEDRVATVRSLTRGTQMLFLFDAARDHDQVRQVIPAEPRCAVIITSRREIASALGLAPQQPLGRTTLADSLDIFSAISGYAWTRAPESVVKVIELCGRLPLAIRSAAEQFRDGTDMHRLIERLSAPETRLDVLNYAGRAVEERVGSEVHRLLSEQRRALALLSHLEGDTFVPWVLLPMMAIDKGEAAAIVASLAAAQLIEKADRDAPNRPRYRLNPLVGLLARAQTTPPAPMIDEEDIRQAQTELANAYVTVVDGVLTEYDPAYRPTAETSRSSATPTPMRQIADSLELYVRREYRTILWLLTDAQLNQPLPDAMVWRCAASLATAVPADVGWTRMEPIFTKALESAERDDARADVKSLAAADVLLAKASFLVAVEKYSEADDALATVDARLTADAPQGSDATLARRLRVLRVRSSAYLQAAAYQQVATQLQQAYQLIAALPTSVVVWPAVQEDLRLLQLYNAEARGLPEDHSIWSCIRPGPVPDGTMARFRQALVRSEELRSRQFWRDAASELRLAEPHRSGDARSLAVIWYRLARLHVEEIHDAEQSPNGPTPDRADPLRREAVRLAAECAWIFETIGDEIGQIRARCLMVRTLILTGQLVAAAQLCYELDEQLHRLREGPKADQPYIWSLRARFARARGELELEHGSYQSAWNSLNFAAATFAKLHDWANRDQVWRLLDKINNDTSGALGEVLSGLRDP